MTPLRRLMSRVRALATRCRGKRAAPVEFEALARLIAAFGDAATPPDVLYAGDSVVERVSCTDADKTGLAELLEDKLRPDIAAVTLSHGAWNPEVYLSIARCFQRLHHRPRLLLLPMNLRCFSPQWAANPKWSFPEVRLAFERFADRGVVTRFVEPRPIPSEAWEAFDATPVHYGGSGLFDRVGPYRLVIAAKGETAFQQAWRRRAIFQFHYMHSLDPAHPRVHALRGLMACLAETRIPAALYFTPINHEGGARHWGERFGSAVREQVDRVTEVVRVSSPATPVHDFSFAFESSYFLHEDEATEHLNERGRARLADTLSVLVRDELAKAPRRV